MQHTAIGKLTEAYVDQISIWDQTLYVWLYLVQRYIRCVQNWLPHQTHGRPKPFYYLAQCLRGLTISLRYWYNAGCMPMDICHLGAFGAFRWPFHCYAHRLYGIALVEDPKVLGDVRQKSPVWLWRVIGFGQNGPETDGISQGCAPECLNWPCTSVVAAAFHISLRILATYERMASKDGRSSTTAVGTVTVTPPGGQATHEGRIVLETIPFPVMHARKTP